MEITVIDIFIYLSVVSCVIATIISAVVIYRRNSNSREHQLFSVFFLGTGGYVLFYLFIENGLLKNLSYVLQLVSCSSAVLGISLFYYALAHEGQLSNKVILICIAALYLIPTICVIFHPYTYITVSYGFELSIEPWFLIFNNIIYFIFFLYAAFGLTWLYWKTENSILKHKLKQIFLAAFMIVTTCFIFLVYIPIFFNIHYLKPLGYIFLTFGIIIMTYAFKKKKSDEAMHQ